MYNNLLTCGVGPQLNSWPIQFLWYWWFENDPSLLKCHNTGATQMPNPCACVKPNLSKQSHLLAY